MIMKMDLVMGLFNYLVWHEASAAHQVSSEVSLFLSTSRPNDASCSYYLCAAYAVSAKLISSFEESY
jgi:hypothetical protein